MSEKKFSQPCYTHPVTVEWETPVDFFSVLDSEFNFETDVCANAENAKCSQFYSPEQDGLAQTWTGTCWMNPPYGREIRKWVGKAYESTKQGTTTVCLVPARTDTKWWWSYAVHSEVRFVRGRLRFLGGNKTNPQSHNAPFPVAVLVFSPSVRPAALWWEWQVREEEGATSGTMNPECSTSPSFLPSRAHPERLDSTRPAALLRERNRQAEAPYQASQGRRSEADDLTNPKVPDRFVSGEVATATRIPNLKGNV